jgi:hypothetical protein
MVKTGLEIRDAIKQAEGILQKAAWDFVDSIDSLADDDIEQIRKVAEFAKNRADMIVATSYQKIESNKPFKSVVVEDAYDPKLVTREGNKLYMDILDYLMVADDPSYERIRRFRNAIARLTVVGDRLELIKYFNSEFGGSHTAAAGSAWEYYK